MKTGSRANVASSFTVVKGAMIDETYAVFAAWDFERSKRENLDRLREENFIGANSTTWLRDVAKVLNRRFDPDGRDRPLVVLAKHGLPVEEWKTALTIKLSPDTTTTVTGALDDTNAIAERGARMRGTTQMGENPGGINVLRSPEWGEIQNKFKPLLDEGDATGYWRAVSDELWDTVNKPWLDEAMARGDQFRMISNPADNKVLFVTANDGTFMLDSGGEKIRSIFGREVDYLTANGYKILADGTVAKGP
jgi:hypothetical protein